MKNIYFLYGIATFAVVGILACFIGYAANTRPPHIPKQQEPVGISTPTVKTETFVKKHKNCNCCAERLRSLRIKMQKAREAREARKRQQAAQQTRTASHEATSGTPASTEKTIGSTP